MGRVIDALVAYRILKLLVTPWKKTKAYELGIIDDKGKVLIKSRQIVNQTQRKAYTLLIRFVFNLKRMLQKVGLGGRFGTYAAAAIAFLKEEYDIEITTDRRGLKYLKNLDNINIKIINSNTVFNKNMNLDLMLKKNYTSI